MAVSEKKKREHRGRANSAARRAWQRAVEEGTVANDPMTEMVFKAGVIDGWYAGHAQGVQEGKRY
jgi:hypothetical protein